MLQKQSTAQIQIESSPKVERLKVIYSVTWSDNAEHGCRGFGWQASATGGPGELLLLGASASQQGWLQFNACTCLLP